MCIWSWRLWLLMVHGVWTWYFTYIGGTPPGPGHYQKYTSGYDTLDILDDSDEDDDWGLMNLVSVIESSEKKLIFETTLPMRLRSHLNASVRRRLFRLGLPKCRYCNIGKINWTVSIQKYKIIPWLAPVTLKTIIELMRSGAELVLPITLLFESYTAFSLQQAGERQKSKTASRLWFIF